MRYPHSLWVSAKRCHTVYYITVEQQKGCAKTISLVTFILQMGHNISELQNLNVNVISSFSMAFCLIDVTSFTT